VDARSGLDGCLGEDVVQVRSGHRDLEGHVRRILGLEGRDQRAGLIEPVNPAVDIPLVRHLAEHAEGAQGAQGVRGMVEPDPYGPADLLDLGDIDGPAAARQQADSGSQALLAHRIHAAVVFPGSLRAPGSAKSMTIRPVRGWGSHRA
jgi:hypothetical protein